MKFSALLATAFAFLALPGHAQPFSGGVSVDLGLGAQAEPTFPGSEDTEVNPWLIWRNVSFGGAATGETPQGLSFRPSFNSVGARDEDDDSALIGLDEIDTAYELGGQLNYGLGAVTAYASLRKGFGGHHGLVGTVGAKYRTNVNDRLTLWSGISLGYADDDYMDTYFGVSPQESLASGYGTYSPDGGLQKATAKFEARYSLNDSTALLGEIEYGRLVGDAEDSPIVQDRAQPAVRLGIVRTFNFGF